MGLERWKFWSCSPRGNIPPRSVVQNRLSRSTEHPDRASLKACLPPRFVAGQGSRKNLVFAVISRDDPDRPALAFKGRAIDRPSCLMKRDQRFLGTRKRTGYFVVGVLQGMNAPSPWRGHRQHTSHFFLCDPQSRKLLIKRNIPRKTCQFTSLTGRNRRLVRFQ